MRAYCRRCDGAVDAVGAWPGGCAACGSPIEAHPVADVARPGLRILFVGINPGIRTARERRHFANTRNAFWGALHESGLTPERIDPARQERLLDLGMGITNVVTRATPGSADVTKEDVLHGRARLRATVERLAPAWLAFVGKEAFRMATGAAAGGHGEGRAFPEETVDRDVPESVVGRAFPEETVDRDVPEGNVAGAPFAGARTFVLPSTSPRNAHLTPAEKTEWFRRLREAAMRDAGV